MADQKRQAGKLTTMKQPCGVSASRCTEETVDPHYWGGGGGGRGGGGGGIQLPYR